MELKEEKIQGLESRLEESSSLNQQLRTELASVRPQYTPQYAQRLTLSVILFIHLLSCYTFAHLLQVKKTLEALRQRQEEEAAHSEISQKAVEQVRSGTSQEKWETEQREITTELLKLKDHLIDVEKNVCESSFYVLK